MKGRWNGGSFTPGMEESPRPHRSSSSTFSPQSSLSVRFFPRFPNIPSYFPSTAVTASTPVYLPLSSPPSSSLLIVPSLLPNVRPLSLRPRSSPSLRSLPFLPSPPPCQPREEIHFREKKGKKARKIDAPRRLAALSRARVCIRSRSAHGRGLKMSSRCVIAYIDPTLPGVYAAPTDATPTPRDPWLRRPRRCVHGRRDASTGAIASVHVRGAHSITAPARITCVCGDVYGVAWKRWDSVSIISSGLILMTSHVVVICIKFQIRAICECCL